MPAGLDIDHSSPLDGTMAPYDSHLIIRTGRNDWPSRIEEDEGLPLVQGLKRLLTRGGKYVNVGSHLFSQTSMHIYLGLCCTNQAYLFPLSDEIETEHQCLQPFHNILITTSSHPDQSLILWPSMRRIQGIDNSLSDPNLAESLVKGFLLPKQLVPRAKETLSSEQQKNLIHDPLSAESILSQHEVSYITDLKVLICGHGNRDDRCGILGPLLQAEFEDRCKEIQPGYAGPDLSGTTVELISHIGGHKFAGNMILYFPKAGMWENHPLSGMGIWYGRVEPKHIEGIVDATVRNGSIIKELFRGGLDSQGGMLRI